MKKIFAYLIAALGLMLTETAATGCIFWILGEPKNFNFDD